MRRMSSSAAAKLSEVHLTTALILMVIGYAFMANVMKLDQDTIAYTYILELVSDQPHDLVTMICLNCSRCFFLLSL